MSDSDPKIIDVDDPSTWPRPVADFVDEFAEELRGSTDFTADLSGQLVECEREFRALLSGHKLPAFHSTRLLDYEVTSIRSQGLLRLSLELVQNRIDQAYERDFLSEEERELCLASNVYAIDNLTGREDQICLVIGRAIFNEEAHGLSPLLGGWGGEAMNGWPKPDENPLLRRLGRPAIVAANVDLDASSREIYAAPGLAQVFIGSRLGLRDAFGEIFVFADIPAEDISAIWQPGDPDYDRHKELPH